MTLKVVTKILLNPVLVHYTIDSDIDHGRTRLYHVWSNHCRLADRCHEDIGLARVPCKIDRAAVTDRYRSVAIDQHHGNWLANNIAAAQYNCVTS